MRKLSTKATSEHEVIMLARPSRCKVPKLRRSSIKAQACEKTKPLLQKYSSYRTNKNLTCFSMTGLGFEAGQALLSDSSWKKWDKTDETEGHEINEERKNGRVWEKGRKEREVDIWKEIISRLNKKGRKGRDRVRIKQRKKERKN
jgi:hypothetical protein